MAKTEQPKTPADTAAPAAGVGRKKKLILFGGGAVLALVLLGGIGWVFLGSEDEAPQPVVAEEPAQAIYASLGNRFVVSLEREGKAHHLQVAINVLTREQAVVDELTLHAPLIQSRIVSLLGAQDFDRLRTDEGKVALRAEVLALVQEILSAETGNPGVEQVFFTDFVLQ